MPEPGAGPIDLSQKLELANAEIARLGALIGPDEAKYTDLKIRVWTLRDHAIGAEAMAGTARAQLRAAESALAEANAVARAARDTLTSVSTHLVELDKVRDHRDAMLRSPTWRLGSFFLWPLSRLRRLFRKPT